MGCGCRKKLQRRSQAIKVSGPNPATTNIRLGTNNTVSAQANKPKSNTSLNQGGISAEKRRIQAIRRNEILKKLGKR